MPCHLFTINRTWAKSTTYRNKIAICRGRCCSSRIRAFRGIPSWNKTAFNRPDKSWPTIKTTRSRWPNTCVGRTVQTRVGRFWSKTAAGRYCRSRILRCLIASRRRAFHRRLTRAPTCERNRFYGRTFKTPTWSRSDERFRNKTPRYRWLKRTGAFWLTAKIVARHWSRRARPQGVSVWWNKIRYSRLESRWRAVRSHNCKKPNLFPFSLSRVQPSQISNEGSSQSRTLSYPSRSPTSPRSFNKRLVSTTRREI